VAIASSDRSFVYRIPEQCQIGLEALFDPKPLRDFENRWAHFKIAALRPRAQAFRSDSYFALELRQAPLQGSLNSVTQEAHPNFR
jgi:hypothetical protein